MLKSYDLLEGVLNEIENRLKEDINDKILADNFSLSSAYLRRLFKFAFGQPLGMYIRSRKLTASIEDLLMSNRKILDIVLDYGFEYEQSYNRTFKREFGITPGELRKSGQIVKITPPLQLFDYNRFGDGLIFDSDIVMVPQFHVVGKKYKVPCDDASAPLMKSLTKQFLFNERLKIPNVVKPYELINICSYSEVNDNTWYFMPSMRVKSLERIPEGFERYTFPTSICARFHFIFSDFRLVNNNFDEINANFDKSNPYAYTDVMKTVDDFADSKNHKYFLDKKVNVNKFYFSEKNRNYLQLEWFAPVVKKSSLKISS